MNVSELELIHKTKRIQYIFEKTRIKQENLNKLQIDINNPFSMSLSERADLETVNDIRFWTQKYMLISTILGINSGFFTYKILSLSLHWYIALPIGFATFYVSRNLIMKNSLDRIYFSLQDIFFRFRDESKVL